MSVFHTAPVCEDLDSVKGYQLDVCRMPLHCGLCNVFLMIVLGVLVLGRKTIEVKCHFHHALPGAHAVNLVYHC